MSTVLILGGGMAGGRLVQELVRLGSRDKLVLAGREGPGVYNRVHLAPALTGPVGDDFWLVRPEWLADRGVTVLAGHGAQAVDRDRRTVTFHNGREERYDKLVLALGARPRLPPIPGLRLEGVHALRSLADARRLRSDLAVRRQVLVLGGGVLGLETAAELIRAGHAVTVVHSGASVLDRLLSAEAAGALVPHLEALGLRLLTGEQCAGLVGSGGRVSAARFASGRTVGADLVVLSAGMVPETSLARSAGLEVRRGIVVDDRLATSDPAIHAVGDCLEWNGRLWGLVSSSYEQARTLARILTGHDERFEPRDHPPVRLKAPVLAAGFGLGVPEPGDDVVQVRRPGEGFHRRLILRDGRLVGGETVGGADRRVDPGWDALETAFVEGRVLEGPPEALLEGGPGPSAGDWPDHRAVCDCNGVTAGDVRAALASGAEGFAGVVARTKAGTGCGSCRGRLRLVVDTEVPPAPVGRLGRWGRAFREKKIRGYTPYWILSYVLDGLLLVGSLLLVVTGLLKFPGLLAALGISIRRLPMDLFMALHDWGGLAVTFGVLAHLGLHWGMLVSFVRSMVRRR